MYCIVFDCSCCSISYDWYRLCNDELLWRNILLQRSRSWLQIYDDTDPEFYRRVCPSMPSKQMSFIYHQFLYFVLFSDIFAVIRILQKHQIVLLHFYQTYFTIISHRLDQDLSCLDRDSKRKHRVLFDRF